MLIQTSADIALPAGPFTASDLEKVGVSRWELTRMLAEGRVRAVLREVFAREDQPDTIEHRAMAVSLVAPPHAVMCDRTAAWLWGVDVLRPWELDCPPRLDIFALRGHTRMRRPQAGGGQRDLRPDEVVRVAGVRITTPVRTSLDLACRSGPGEALAVMDQFARRHDVGVAVLQQHLPRFRGRRGVVQARRLVPLVDPRTESTGESFTRLAIHDEGLPNPEPQYWVEVGGVPTYRLDLAYPRLKICVEYDGEEYHSSEEAKRADRIRRKWLRDHGWIVIVVRKTDFRGAARDEWLHELRRALADRMRVTQ